MFCFAEIVKIFFCSMPTMGHWKGKNLGKKCDCRTWKLTEFKDTSIEFSYHTHKLISSYSQKNPREISGLKKRFFFCLKTSNIKSWKHIFLPEMRFTSSKQKRNSAVWIFYLLQIFVLFSFKRNSDEKEEKNRFWVINFVKLFWMHIAVWDFF